MTIRNSRGSFLPLIRGLLCCYAEGCRRAAHSRCETAPQSQSPPPPPPPPRLCFSGQPHSQTGKKGGKNPYLPSSLAVAEKCKGGRERRRLEVFLLSSPPLHSLACIVSRRLRLVAGCGGYDGLGGAAGWRKRTCDGGGKRRHDSAVDF